MKDFLVAFMVFLLWSVFGLWIFNNTGTKNKTLQVPDQTTTLDKKETDSAVQGLYDPDDFNQRITGKFIITEGEGTVKEKNSNDFKDYLQTYLTNNPDQVLTIYGLYQRREPYTIAERRAETLKSIFIKYGIDSNRILTVSKERDFMYKRNGEYDNGFIFELESIPVKAEKVADDNTFNRVLFTKFASNTFNPDEPFGAYVDSLKIFLDQNRQKTISVTGHTDATGEETDNEWIGLQRAKSVAGYLVSKGITEDRIRVGSAGETEPIGDNNTQEGRRKNRRIVIIIN
ncbi:OmpA family protein [Zhouia spongiae]|uniref:OmpA family protein n=1 Tax=Zhouia spongiae TaxID=2202721 RepID=A0ABY3YLH5_9FLAO|nr:OmpA family protein [Zhouia spongiae]UNY98013.1 OmpA family protein [Zhouia spongiae]